MNLIKRTLIFLLLNSIALTAMAENAADNRQVNTLTEYFKDIKSLDISFEQTVFSGSNTSKQNSQGIILVEHPNKFYLEYTQPFKLIYVADGQKLWSYDEDLEQVVVKVQGNLLADTPAMLLSHPQDLAESYHIEQSGEDEGWLWFELIPKQQNSSFESISLAFAKNQLKAMEMRDNFGQTTRLEFTKVRKNPKLSPKTFIFTPPLGVDVIGP